MLSKLYDESTGQHCSIVLVNGLEVWRHVVSCPYSSRISEAESLFAILSVEGESVSLELWLYITSWEYFFKKLIILQDELTLCIDFLLVFCLKVFTSLNIKATLVSPSSHHAKYPADLFYQPWFAACFRTPNQKGFLFFASLCCNEGLN